MKESCPLHTGSFFLRLLVYSSDLSVSAANASSGDGGRLDERLPGRLVSFSDLIVSAASTSSGDGGRLDGRLPGLLPGRLLA